MIFYSCGRKLVARFSRLYFSFLWRLWTLWRYSRSLTFYLTASGRQSTASFMRFLFRRRCHAFVNLRMSRIWTMFSGKLTFSKINEDLFLSINAMVAIGGMFTFPILNGMLIDYFGDFRVTFVIAGVCLFLSSMALIIARLCNKRKASES